MKIGQSLFSARKKSGLSQEQVAEKLNISRQTISKWESDETLPNICQFKDLANLYNVSIDELYDYDKEYIEIQNMINNANDNLINKIDWTKAWSKKYPILGEYQKQIDIEKYALRINKILDDLKFEYKFNDLDAMLVLKDILYTLWKSKK